MITTAQMIFTAGRRMDARGAPGTPASSAYLATSIILGALAARMLLLTPSDPQSASGESLRGLEKNARGLALNEQPTKPSLRRL